MSRPLTDAERALRASMRPARHRRRRRDEDDEKPLPAPLGWAVQNAFYFGHWYIEGHAFWLPEGFQVSPSVCREAGVPRQFMGRLGWGPDGVLCPGADENGNAPKEVQIQGLARLHHAGGWTALSFWDRSGDSRSGSSSTFLFRGTLDFQEACRAASTTFEGIWPRFYFKVRPLCEDEQQQPGDAPATRPA